MMIATSASVGVGSFIEAKPINSDDGKSTFQSDIPHIPRSYFYNSKLLFTVYTIYVLQIYTQLFL